MRNILQKMVAILKQKCYSIKYTISSNNSVNDSDRMVTNMQNYTAQDIARYIIDRAHDKKYTITNLQLQKILYFSWIDYYIQTDEELFSEFFRAWRLGPVVLDVYDAFKRYGAEPIPMGEGKKTVDLYTDVILRPIVDMYIGVPASELVERSHCYDGAWYCTYDDGKGERNPISFSLIKMKCR